MHSLLKTGSHRVGKRKFGRTYRKVRLCWAPQEHVMHQWGCWGMLTGWQRRCRWPQKAATGLCTACTARCSAATVCAEVKRFCEKKKVTVSKSALHTCQPVNFQNFIKIPWPTQQGQKGGRGALLWISFKACPEHPPLSRHMYIHTLLIAFLL